MTMILYRGFSSLLLAAAASFSLHTYAQPAAPAAPASTATSASATKAASDSTVLLRGPAGEVTLGQVRAAIQVIVPVSQRESFFANPRNIEQMALSIYIRQNLAAQAKKQGLDQQPEVARAVTFAQQHALSDLWLAKKSRENEPTPAQLEKYAQSVYDSQPATASEPKSAADFASKRAELMEQARTKVLNQSRAELWNAAQAGAEPDAEAIAASVQPAAEK